MAKVKWLEAFPVDVPGQGQIQPGGTFDMPDDEAKARQEAGQVEIVADTSKGANKEVDA